MRLYLFLNSLLSLFLRSSVSEESYLVPSRYPIWCPLGILSGALKTTSGILSGAPPILSGAPPAHL